MAGRIMINQVTNRVRAIDGQAAIAPETIQALADALLPLVREMLEHDKQVSKEKSLHNGYVDRIERGSL
jgi:hypothetical protein